MKIDDHFLTLGNVEIDLTAVSAAEFQLDVVNFVVDGAMITAEYDHKDRDKISAAWRAARRR